MVRLILIIQLPSQVHNVNIIIDGDSVEFKLKAKMFAQWYNSRVWAGSSFRHLLVKRICKKHYAICEESTKLTGL